MRWETIASNASLEVYKLHKQDHQLLTLTFHPHSNTARVEAGEKKRVFMIRKEGFMRNRSVLRNEYGIKIAELGFDFKDSFVEINNQRLYYKINEKESPVFTLYSDTETNPTLVCKLEKGEFNPGNWHKALLIAISWHLSQHTAVELEESALIY